MDAGVHSVWRGSYFDGRTAARHAVTITLMETGLRLTKVDGTIIWWPYGEIRQAAGSGAGGRAQFEHGPIPAELLVVEDARIIAAMRRVSPVRRPRVRIPAGRMARLRLAALAVVGAIAMGAALYVWAIPALASAVAASLPVAWEEQLGEAVVESVTADLPTCGDPAQKAALQKILSTLTAAAPPNPYTFRLTVVRNPQINAFAAPGGYIVVFDGLLRKTKSPEELAGVLAHEIQHVLHRDGTQALVRQLSLSALISLASGNTRGFSSVLQAAGSLGVLRYGREAEAAADRGAMALLRAARIAPEGFVSFMVTVQKEQARIPRVPTYLSNHPSTDERIATLRRLAADTPYTPVRLVPDYPWQDMAHICR